MSTFRDAFSTRAHHVEYLDSWTRSLGGVAELESFVETFLYARSKVVMHPHPTLAELKETEKFHLLRRFFNLARGEIGGEFIDRAARDSDGNVQDGFDDHALLILLAMCFPATVDGVESGLDWKTPEDIIRAARLLQVGLRGGLLWAAFENDIDPALAVTLHSTEVLS